MKPDISIIAPVYNEQEVLDIYFEKMEKVLKSLPGKTYEYIFVNDGSKDATLNILKERAGKNPNIKIISLSRNFKKEAGLFCGMQYCSGKAAVLMDVDLQDPPELIIDFIKKWEEGFDVVYGIRKNRRQDGFFKRVTSEIFYKIYNSVAFVKIPYNTGDFRLIDRKVINAVLSLNDRVLFMKGLLSWVGFKSIGIEYKRAKRAAGKTKWKYWKLWNFALDGLTAYSSIPLRIWTYIGFIIWFLSVIYLIFIFVRTVIMGIVVPGYASLITIALFFGGIQLFVLGVIGEYIARIFEQVKNKPIYIVDEKIGFDS